MPDDSESAWRPGGPNIGRLVTVKPRSILTAKVLTAARQLDEAIKEAVITCGDIQRDTAEGQLSSLLAGAWNRAECHIRRIPLKEGRRPIDD